MRYKIRVKINGSEYTKYLQENTTIQRAVDETLDVGSFTLSFMSIRKPFAPYSKVEIIREQENSLPQTDIMLLESDLVQESSYGTRSYYKHIIKCVEWTQWLSTYNLPDIAITQPITAFVFPLASPTITEDAFNKEVYKEVGWGLTIRDELYFTDTTYSVRSKYIAPLDLKDTVRRSFFVTAYAVASRAGDKFEVDRGDVSYTFYYKLAGNWLPVPSSWSPDSGEYEIEARMNTINYKYLRFKNKSVSSASEIATATINTNQKLKFTVEVVSELDSNDIYTVKEAIEKVIGSYFLEELGVTYNAIKLDEELVTRLSLDSLKCPEMTLVNGRTMFEALASIGKEFDGIPRLYLDDNGDTILTYDIVSEPEDNPLYEDDDSLEMEEANMTNYASGIVGNVANMTSAEHLKYYPGIIDYVTCRCDPSENALLETNMSILLNDNIYKIKEVFVKNWKDGSPGEIVDITDYIYEKTVYNSLNNNAGGKGLALYFERGSNKIVGLGFLPNTQSLLGLSNDDYVIKRIIKHKTGLTTDVSDDVLDYRYNVTYVPYVDGRIVSVQDNLSDTAYPLEGAKVVYSAYNQETADISAELYGQTVQKTLQRLGNNDITKETFVYNITQRPLLGELKVVDGVNYYANIINEEYQNNRIRLAVQYTKDFNKINNRVGIDKKYREYSLYSNNFVNRTININDYCEVKYFVNSPTYPTSDESLAKLCTEYYNAHNPSRYAEPDPEYGYLVVPPYDGFWITPYQANGTTMLKYTPFEQSETTVPITFVSTSYRRIGNAINYMGWCYDNFAVGQYIEKGNESVFAFNNAANRDARYVDDVGECPVLGILLGNASVYAANSIVGGRALPLASATKDLNFYLWDTRKYRINKDNRERIGINYSVHSVTTQKGVYIISAANKYVFSMESDVLSNLKELLFIGFKGSIRSKTILKYAQNDIMPGTVSLNRPLSTSSYFFVVHTPSGYVDDFYDGFAVVYAGTGEILYSVETPITPTSNNTRYIRLNFVKQLTD